MEKFLLGSVHGMWVLVALSLFSPLVRSALVRHYPLDSDYNDIVTGEPGSALVPIGTNGSITTQGGDTGFWVSSFNSDASLFIPIAAIPNRTTFSVTIRFSSPQLGTDGGNQGLLDFNGINPAGDYSTVCFNSDKLSLVDDAGSGNAGTTPKTKSNVMYRIDVTRDETGLVSAYQDRILSIAGQYGAVWEAPGGWIFAINGRRMYGFVDDFKIYDHAMTAQEIATTTSPTISPTGAPTASPTTSPATSASPTTSTPTAITISRSSLTNQNLALEIALIVFVLLCAI